MSTVLTERSALFLRQAPTAPTPPANFVETNKPILVTPTFAKISTNRMNGAMNAQDELIDLCRSKASFTAGVDMRATGANMTAVPEYAELMKVCGFNGVASADTYDLGNTVASIPHGSAQVFLDGHKFTFTDTLVGAMTMNFVIGQVANISTVLSGYIDSEVPTDETNPKVALNPEKALVVSCMDIVSYDGTVIPTESIIIKTNPQIAESYTMGGASGIKQNTITNYSLTMDIKFPVEGTEYGEASKAIRDGDIKEIRIVIGADSAGKPVDGESVVIKCDASKMVSYTDSDNAGLLDRVLSFRLFDNTKPAMVLTTGKTSGL